MTVLIRMLTKVENSSGRKNFECDRVICTASNVLAF
jgi:hypothetical protein